MGFWRRLHVLALLALAACGSADGAPPRRTPAGAGSGSGSAGDPPKPAGSSAVESSDVPPFRTNPERFAISPFVNHSGARAMDWLVIGAPFEMVEKTEDVIGFEPTGGPLRVGAKFVEPEPEPVAEFAREQNATWVITGWVDRYNWNLRLAATLWRVTVTGKTSSAVVVAEVQRTGEPKLYHQLLGEVLAQLWSKGAGVQVDIARASKLQRVLSSDLYAVNLMARGLGQMLGVYGAVNLKAAQADLEKAVFIDPKCPEAQRLVGELYAVLATTDPKAGGDPKYAARAAGKFAYANDLAPDNIGGLHAAASAATRAGKHDVARDILRKLVTRKPWELEARFEYGAALYHTGELGAAEKQLLQVTQHMPDHLPARRVLVLIHAARGETSKLVSELEAIQLRAPNDLDVKADLATAYGSLDRWDRAAQQLEQIALVRPNDLALLVRIGDAHRRAKDLDTALTWYLRASRAAPDTSLPTFIGAQALVDAGRLAEANRWYLAAQRFREDVGNAEHALGAIALLQNRGTDAAWYLRRAVKATPRVVSAWRSVVAAELTRHDFETALRQVSRALVMWPRDAQLNYLAGVAYQMADEKAAAREKLDLALQISPSYAAARTARTQLDRNTPIDLHYTPEIYRPWGDAKAIAAMLDRFDELQQEMARSRAGYQDSFLKLLAAFGKGPLSPVRKPQPRTCPIDRVAPLWSSAQKDLWRYQRVGVDLEAAYRFIARHDDIGATAALLPNERARVATVKKVYKTVLADVSELRAEWNRGLAPELRYAGCYDKLLAAAVADPERYRNIQEDQPEVLPPQQPPRPKPRATFYIDNTRCPDAVDVWIDGTLLGQVAPGHRSALVADGGERSLCLIVPGAAQCGDRGTVRQVYLHDGWTSTLYCPK